jgi:hypothetical protein
VGIKIQTVKLGVPAQLVHTETNKVLRNYMPYTTFELATYNKERNEGVTLYAYNSYPHKVVFGRIGAKFAGYIT